MKKFIAAVVAVAGLAVVPAALANTITQAGVQANFNCAVVNVPYTNFGGQKVTSTWTVNGVVTTETSAAFQGNGSFLEVVPNLAAAPTSNSYPVQLKLFWSTSEQPVTVTETCFTGPAGPQGAPGATGAQGAAGPAGPQGPKGDKGDTGDTGGTGLPGKDGTNGTDGKDGAQGDKGDIGATGPQGPPGAQGATGPAGPQGAPGTNGTNGTNGVNGTSVKSGVKAKLHKHGKKLKVVIKKLTQPKPKGARCVFGEHNHTKACKLHN